MSDSWDRREDESMKAFSAFVCYRDLGVRRTMEEAYYRYLQNPKKAKKVQGTAPFFKNWAIQFCWKDRAAAFDEHELAQRESDSRSIDRRIRLESRDLLVRLLGRLSDQADLLDPDQTVRAINSLRQVITDFDAGKPVTVSDLKILISGLPSPPDE